jgi:hypothetical protein
LFLIYLTKGIGDFYNNNLDGKGLFIWKDGKTYDGNINYLNKNRPMVIESDAWLRYIDMGRWTLICWGDFILITLYFLGFY